MTCTLARCPMRAQFMHCGWSNVELLRNCGVPDSRILGIVRSQPLNMMSNPERFRMLVEEVKELGFNLIEAIHVMGSLNKSTREWKWDLYRKWGCSDDEILRAFMRQPIILATSKEKIDLVMEFLVNKMGWDASKISSYPIVLMHSLENWTKPRCLVVQSLLSNGD